MSNYDDAWDYALDLGLCRDAAADYAYDVYRGAAPPPVRYPSYEQQVVQEEMGLDPLPPTRVDPRFVEDTYGDRCHR